MKLNNLFLVKAFISVVFGLAFVVVPALIGPIVGISYDAVGEVMARMLGACLAGIGIVCWVARGFEAKARLGIALSLCVADTIGFVIMLIAQLGGLMNGVGWVLVFLWFFFALGLSFFRFLKPDAA